MVAETAHGESDPHVRVGQYLCHTIQYHIVMTEFGDAEFHRNSYMAPSVFNQLFDHMVEKLMWKFSRENIGKNTTSSSNI